MVLFLSKDNKNKTVQTFFKEAGLSGFVFKTHQKSQLLTDLYSFALKSKENVLSKQKINICHLDNFICMLYNNRSHLIFNIFLKIFLTST